MESVFELLVAALIAAAIIYAAVGYFTQGVNDATAELSKQLGLAETDYGNSHPAGVLLKAGMAIKAESLDTKARSVRLECSSAGVCLGGAAEVQTRQLVVRRDTQATAYFRCLQTGGLDSCTIYFGGSPAQVSLENLSAAGSIERGAASQVSFSVKNTGSLDSLDADYDVRIMREPDSPGGREVLQKEISGQVGSLQAGSSKSISSVFSLDSPGHYTLNVVVEGKESGMATASREMTVTDMVSASCTASGKGSTTEENGKCLTEYKCSGCSFEYECISKWAEKGVNTENIETGDQASITVSSAPTNGACG